MMSATVLTVGTGVTADRFIEGFRWMLLSRTLEDKIGALYRANRIVGGVYLGRGQEAFSAALAMALEPSRDVYAPLIRDQAGRLAFGEPVIDTLRTYLGSVLGPMRGRDGNIHRGRPGAGSPAMISHLGSMISVVCGMLMARRFKGDVEAVGAACIGDGATSTGSFHEAVNLAAVEKLPLIVSVANNQFAYSTPVSRQYACEDLSERALGYGIEGYRVDGTDLAACLEVFGRAVALAQRDPQPDAAKEDWMPLASGWLVEGGGGHGECPNV
jgi:pyruvate dehydrogenase E1 component alpha subunit/2-oxoisovalerate dehydrogenase E1 component alpha subunit